MLAASWSSSTRKARASSSPSTRPISKAARPKISRTCARCSPISMAARSTRSSPKAHCRRTSSPRHHPAAGTPTGASVVSCLRCTATNLRRCKRVLPLASAAILWCMICRASCACPASSIARASRSCRASSESTPYRSIAVPPCIAAFPLVADDDEPGSAWTASGQSKRKASRWGELNERALKVENLPRWVPQIFPTATRTRHGGYRVASADLGRGFEEDLSIDPRGIKYFGIADQGDTRQGRRTAVELVAEFQQVEAPQAADWLEKTLGGNGHDPGSIRHHHRSPSRNRNPRPTPKSRSPGSRSCSWSSTSSSARPRPRSSASAPRSSTTGRGRARAAGARWRRRRQAGARHLISRARAVARAG